MVKKNTKQIQILPTLSIKAGKIPAVPLGEDFKYLGKFFNFSMNNETGKNEIVEKLEKMLKILSELHIISLSLTFSRVLKKILSCVCNFFVDTGNLLK